MEDTLTDQSKRWVYVDNEKFNPNSIVSTYIRFYTDQRCENIWFKGNKKYEFGDHGTWEYSTQDSLLKVFNREFKVLNVGPDTISVKYKDEDFKAIFINYRNN